MREAGELEGLILANLRRIQPATVAGVRSSLAQPVAYTTVMTVLDRLYKKGILSREKVGRSYQYSLVEQTSQTWLSRIVKRFGSRSSLLISHLIENCDDLSERDLEEIEEMVRKKREGK